ncbi:MAG: FtsX-like permease family protein, partial [Bryobacterales bacterium]|nr:FtsX-like permease family protein [Bryobacterales bacterium]
RDFSDSDRAGAPPVAIVNEAFAREFFPGQQVLGRQITMRRMKVPDVWTIAGVINDVREMGLKQPVPPAIYALVDQTPLPIMKLVHRFVPAKWMIRIQPGSTGVAEKVRHEVSSLDPSQPFQQFESMQAIVSQTMLMERFLMLLLGAFAMLTLAMVASGLYGTLAYAVAERRQEIGIRMALGAQATSIAAMIVRSGFTQVACGILIGLAASYWATKAMAGLLFGLPPMDPLSLSVSAAVLLLVGIIAGLGPSLSAARTDPLRTLRVE